MAASGNLPAVRAVSSPVGRTTGRDEAVPVLFVREYPRLVRTGYALIGDRTLAEEVVQDAFIGLWRHWPRLREEHAAPAYLHRSVVNGSRTAVRRRRTERERAKRDEVPHYDTDVGGGVDLLAAIRRLPMRKRACVVLRYYADLTESEVADVLGISVGTVKSQTDSTRLRALAEILAHPAA